MLAAFSGPQGESPPCDPSQQRCRLIEPRGLDPSECDRLKKDFPVIADPVSLRFADVLIRLWPDHIGLTSQALGTVVAPVYGQHHVSGDGLDFELQFKSSTAANCMALCGEGAENWTDQDQARCESRCSDEALARYGKAQVDFPVSGSLTLEKGRFRLSLVETLDPDPIPGDERFRFFFPGPILSDTCPAG